MSAPGARWCLSRSRGAVCTRPRGHAGLHNRAGTSRMWSDREADAPFCPGSGMPQAPAQHLADDGFPHGAALCEICWGFVPLDDVLGGGFTPSNADNLERGPVRVRNALQFSLNIPSVKAMAVTPTRRTPRPSTRVRRRRATAVS